MVGGGLSASSSPDPVAARLVRDLAGIGTTSDGIEQQMGHRRRIALGVLALLLAVVAVTIGLVAFGGEQNEQEKLAEAEAKVENC